ncbi:hypothetical protein [Microcoleus sp. S13_C5]|uniref:hypothetical protein n=1 Tax=Microcoleus sp. S13_C5 TaxID=3055411 RepID=UPI002FD2CFB8
MSITQDLTDLPKFPGLQTLIRIESERQVYRANITGQFHSHENQAFVGAVSRMPAPTHRRFYKHLGHGGSHGGQPLQENETALAAEGVAVNSFWILNFGFGIKE